MTIKIAFIFKNELFFEGIFGFEIDLMFEIIYFKLDLIHLNLNFQYL